MTRPESIVTLGSGKPLLRTVNFCVFGPPGIGKTVFTGSAGKGTFIMDSDLGSESAEAMGSNADVMPVPDYEELHKAYDFLANDKHDYNFVWWDSLTLFQDRTLIDDILVDAHADNPRQSEDVASQREYLVNQNRIGKYVRLFIALPINFGFTAHVMTGPNPQDPDQLLYMPMLQGGKGEFASKIAGYMNMVGYLGFANVPGPNGNKIKVQRMQFRASDTVYAKDRFNALGAYMDRPTLPKVMDLIEAKRTSKPAPARRATKKVG